MQKPHNGEKIEMTKPKKDKKEQQKQRLNEALRKNLSRRKKPSSKVEEK